MAPGPRIAALARDYAYAPVFFVAILAGQTVRFFLGSDPIIGAQPAQILIPLVAFPVSVALWLASPAPIRLPSRRLTFLFGLLLLIWLWALVRDWAAFDLTTFTLGPFLAMLAAKHPPPAVAAWVLKVVSTIALALFAVGALYALVAGIPPTGYIAKWPPLTDPFDPIGMWWAPFNGPAESGFLGGVLVLVGLANGGVLRVILVVGGSVMLFFGGTLSAALGLAAGLLVFWVGQARNSNRKGLTFTSIAIALLLGIAMLVRELVENPSLSRRSFIWADFIELAMSNPIIGWGSSVLIQSEATQQFPRGGARSAHGSDAHNIVLDAWARYGFMAAAVVFCVGILSVLIATEGWRASRSEGLSLVVFMLTVGLVEAHIWWLSPGVGITVFLLAVLVGSKSVSSQRGETPIQGSCT